MTLDGQPQGVGVGIVLGHCLELESVAYLLVPKVVEGDGALVSTRIRASENK